MNVIYEDQHSIVVVKPPKVPSQSDPTGDVNMIEMIRDYLIDQNPQAKDPYVGLIHRLDRPVGGVMVYAKTKYGNSQLSLQVQKKEMKKSYLGVVCGRPTEKSGELKHYLKKIGHKNLSKVVTDKNQGKEARLTYTVLETCTTEEGDLSLLQIHLITGRHHQIRVQTGEAGWPLWGDTKYNPAFVRRKDWTQIALWGYSLEFKHPKTGKRLAFSALPEGNHPFSLFTSITSK